MHARPGDRADHTKAGYSNFGKWSQSLVDRVCWLTDSLSFAAGFEMSQSLVDRVCWLTRTLRHSDTTAKSLNP